MIQPEECISIHNVDKAIWLGISVYWDSCDSSDSRSGKGSVVTSFACRNDYSDEFESRPTIEDHMYPIL